MGYLNKIIGFINDQLKARSFSDSRFAGAEYFSGATIIPMEEDGRAVVKLVSLDAEGNTLCDNLIYDDVACMRIFHIIRDSNWVESPTEDFGHHIANKRVTNISMIAFAKRKTLKLDGDDL